QWGEISPNEFAHFAPEPERGIYAASMSTCKRAMKRHQCRAPKLRFMESRDLQQVDPHWDHEPSGARTACPRVSRATRRVRADKLSALLPLRFMERVGVRCRSSIPVVK